MEAAETCSRCPAVLDTEGSPKWCKACRTQYQKDHKATKQEMAEAKAFADGCVATKNALANAFMAHPIGMFYGAEAAKYCANFKSPSFVQKTTDSGANGG